MKKYLLTISILMTLSHVSLSATNEDYENITDIFAMMIILEDECNYNLNQDKLITEINTKLVTDHPKAHEHIIQKMDAQWDKYQIAPKEIKVFWCETMDKSIKKFGLAKE